MNDPTPEDRVRDLQDDMAICDAASPGPWVAWWVNGQPTIASGNAFGNVVNLPRVSVDRGECLKPEDSRFIAAAHEGWPAAIRRAVAAETRLAVSETCQKTWEMMCDHEQELEQEVARFRAALEAISCAANAAPDGDYGSADEVCVRLGEMARTALAPGE